MLLGALMISLWPLAGGSGMADLGHAKIEQMLPARPYAPAVPSVQVSMRPLGRWAHLGRPLWTITTHLRHVRLYRDHSLDADQVISGSGLEGCSIGVVSCPQRSGGVIGWLD